MPTRSYVTGSGEANATFISEIPAELTCLTIRQGTKKSDRFSITLNPFGPNEPFPNKDSQFSRLRYDDCIPSSEELDSNSVKLNYRYS